MASPSCRDPVCHHPIGSNIMGPRVHGKPCGRPCWCLLLVPPLATARIHEATTSLETTVGVEQERARYSQYQLASWLCLGSVLLFLALPRISARIRRSHSPYNHPASVPRPYRLLHPIVCVYGLLVGSSRSFPVPPTFEAHPCEFPLH